MSIRDAYAEKTGRNQLQHDPAQLRVLDELDKLQILLRSQEGGRRRLHRLLRLPVLRPQADIAGLYIWGGVGRGKTFLMDLFIETLDIKRKKRIHFHRMMRDVHAQLKSFEAIEDPLDRVAENIARHTDILCFDELFVSDIADAMIMGRLLDSLFRRGVTLVATSNSPPEDLYRGGLQRDRFLPAIALLEKCTLVIELDGETDYRLRLLQQAGTFLVPHNQEAHDKVQHLFDELAPGKIIENHPLEILGRVIPTQRCAKDVVWFDFSDLCDGPRSQQDYIELARWFQTVIVSNVPILNVGNEDAARRFIALVDEFYDRKVKLLLSAAAPVASLYQGKKLGFEFQRTSSRLIEMQTRAYQHTAHIA